MIARSFHSLQVEFFYLLFLRVRPGLVAWIFVSFFIPLMVVEIVPHLPNCFCHGSLVFYRNFREASAYIKLNVATF